MFCLKGASRLKTVAKYLLSASSTVTSCDPLTVIPVPDYLCCSSKLLTEDTVMVNLEITYSMCLFSPAVTRVNTTRTDRPQDRDFVTNERCASVACSPVFLT